MRIYSIVRRLREWLIWAMGQIQPKCHFCGKPIDCKAVLLGTNADGALIHHKDHNRANNLPDNLVICHRGCHQAYHKRVDVRSQEGLVSKTESW